MSDCQYCDSDMHAGHVIEIEGKPAHLACALDANDLTEEVVTLDDKGVTLGEPAEHEQISGEQDKDPGGRAFPIMAIEDVTEFDASGKFSLGLMPEEPTADAVVNEEFDVIVAGITAAQKHGLLVEFIWSLHQSAKGGSPIAESVGYALSEWDM